MLCFLSYVYIHVCIKFDSLLPSRQLLKVVPICHFQGKLRAALYQYCGSLRVLSSFVSLSTWLPCVHQGYCAELPQGNCSSCALNMNTQMQCMNNNNALKPDQEPSILNNLESDPDQQRLTK